METGKILEDFIIEFYGIYIPVSIPDLDLVDETSGGRIGVEAHLKIQRTTGWGLARLTG